MEGMNAGWYYSPEHGQLCRVIETQTLWGKSVCCAWLPAKDTVVQLPATRLRPVHGASASTADGIASLVTARKITGECALGGPEVVDVVRSAALAIWGGMNHAKDQTGCGGTEKTRH